MASSTDKQPPEPFTRAGERCDGCGLMVAYGEVCHEDSPAHKQGVRRKRIEEPIDVTVSVKVDGRPLDVAEVFRHMEPPRSNPMPPWGWRHLVESCCARCAAVAAAERDARRYYGTLFGEVVD